MLQFLFLVGLVTFPAIQGHDNEEDFSDLPTDVYDSDLSNFIKDILENFRDDMTVGIPSMGVPPLDPLKLSNIEPISIDKNDIDLNVANFTFKMKDINVMGLSKYRIDNLYVNINKGFLKFNISVPELMTNGHYNLKGRVLKLFDVQNEGPFNILIKQVGIQAYGILNISKSEQVKVQVEDLSLSLTFSSIAVEFPNVFGEGKYSKLVQGILTNVGKQLFEQFHREAMTEISKALLTLINKELNQRTISKLFFGF